MNTFVPNATIAGVPVRRLTHIADDGVVREFVPSVDYDAALEAVKITVRSPLYAYRAQINLIPTREELLGGQRTKYVQLDEVLALIDIEEERTRS